MAVPEASLLFGDDSNFEKCPHPPGYRIVIDTDTLRKSLINNFPPQHTALFPDSGIFDEGLAVPYLLYLLKILKRRGFQSHGLAPETLDRNIKTLAILLINGLHTVMGTGRERISRLALLLGKEIWRRGIVSPFKVVDFDLPNGEYFILHVENEGAEKDKLFLETAALNDPERFNIVLASPTLGMWL
ncbi:hypothetical protein AJ80_08824 [Polytolypa hystricis UAMH7299]|uniref:Uncharacterized protein n=1 Tax=Polytolypa hystricis (strain UAMH7299) TaxID=1447883 RepID=A0A2B7X1J1_POLH7|nr:hypothetical protein AJ80_08824 [Polytolypa hystricis UAMH7299]